jgi:xylulokinase
MLLLGIDVGTSSIKVSVVDADTQKIISSASYPETETEIISLQNGWAEQSPDLWWDHVQEAILHAHAKRDYNPQDIGAIGITYQMHGLVLVDKNQHVLRNSIIWCDSRAVPYGEKAFQAIGAQKCLGALLNSPGNFTASKLAWVKDKEPDVFNTTDKMMLPGDFIAMKLTGEITTSISALSEAILWNFREDKLSADVMDYYGFDEKIIPAVHDVFSTHGHLGKRVAMRLSLREGIPVSYKAGDQPNNALSVNVLNPGEVAATAGTSGVIYGVSDQLAYDKQSRVNSFAHVNYTSSTKRIGILLCINGTGIMNRWIKTIAGDHRSYQTLNEEAARIKTGSEGLLVLPFGNGAERMLNNVYPGASFRNIDLNKHSASHLYRAGQEGIAFAFRYGLDIMRENKMLPSVIRAGKANMFLSPVFTEAFVNATNVPVELYQSDGSVGAALGAGIGAGIFKTPAEAFSNQKRIALIEPTKHAEYDEVYGQWRELV